MAQLKSSNILGNLAISGNTLSSQFIKLGGTSSQLLRADGSAGMITSTEIQGVLGYLPPSTTGVNASGTWGINITGTAATANKVNSNLIIKFNNGSTEGTSLFTYNGGSAKTINITPAAIGAAAEGHTHSYLPLSGGTMSGAITSTYASSTWINSANGKSAFNLTGTGYTGWISGPSANGRLVISSYPADNNNLYFGYMSSGTINKGTNSFDKTMRWEGNTGSLFTDKFIVASKVTLQYNSTYKALEFSF